MPALGNLTYLVSQASMELGIAQKTIADVVNSKDQDIIQLRSLIQATADEILKDEPYKRTLGDGVFIQNAPVGTTPGTKKGAFTANTDIVLIDARLMINGLKFRFLKAKGLEFGEELRDFAVRMNKIARAVNGKIYDLDDYD